MKKQNFFCNSVKATILFAALLFSGVQAHAQLSIWHFDGNTVASPADYNGTATGSPTYSAGKLNDAITLSSGKYVITPFMLDPVVTSFTATAWVYYTGVINNTLNISPAIVQQADGHGTGRGWLWLSAYSATAAQSLKFASSIGGSATYGTTTPLANTWYMVSVTYAATSVKLYVNGVLQTTTTKTAEASDGGLLIGCNKSFATPWTGSLDEVAVYNSALTAQALLDLYNNTVTSYSSVKIATNKIYTVAKSIVVEGVTSEVAVSDLSGRNLQSLKMAGTFTSKPLSAGVYMVHVDGAVKKVLVK